MQHNLFTIIPLMAPAILFLFALIAAFNRKNQSFKPTPALEYLAAFGVLLSVVSAFIVYQYGTIQSPILGWEGVGLAIRMDSLSITMLVMITIMAYAVARFSNNYLDGDPRKTIFMLRLATTIASVELLVLSGNLGQLLFFWMATSICLHYLLVFYRFRPQAIVAARKKYFAARIGDLSLLIAFILIYQEFGTGDLEVIFSGLQGYATLSSPLLAATVFLVIAAALKSAQFPMHGWLVEVVETPTPVSALLHAGLLNAGPFLMVRMSYMLNLSTTASLMLIAIGGFTAIFASVVYMTQPTIKVSLGYSSIAHMGFSLLICGFGVYSAALLHVVAHSFYKAHAFLSSGSVIDAVRARKVGVPKRIGSIGRVLLSVVSALGIYTFFCYIWGIHPEKEFNLLVTGAIIVMGLSLAISATLDTKGSLLIAFQSALLAFFTSASFFGLEYGSRVLLGSQLPQEVVHPFAIKIAAGVILLFFALVIFIQLIAPRLKAGSFGYSLGVHLRNGLYVSVVYDRMIGSLKNDTFKWANLTIQEEPDTELIHAPEIKKEAWVEVK